jgi:hypothetical protein
MVVALTHQRDEVDENHGAADIAHSGSGRITRFWKLGAVANAQPS